MHGFEKEISQEDEQLNIRSTSMPTFYLRKDTYFICSALPETAGVQTWN